mgnify:CR=1 FL=1
MSIMENKVKISTQNLNLYYGENHALKNINLDLYENKITAFIGPSGCGKSTYLKTLNRMNDLVPNVKIEGTVLLDGEDIYDPQVDTTLLRKKVGMVFQQPNPFPMSIYDNVAYGPRIHGIKNKAQLDEIVERSLKGAALWDEVSDRLKKSALGLSGGQQQRLCIARALAVEPEVLLMDICTGPDFYLKDRGPDGRSEEQVYGCYCYPQHAAGNPYCRLYSIFPGRRGSGICYHR